MYLGSIICSGGVWQGQDQLRKSSNCSDPSTLTRRLNSIDRSVEKKTNSSINCLIKEQRPPFSSGAEVEKEALRLMTIVHILFFLFFSSTHCLVCRAMINFHDQEEFSPSKNTWTGWRTANETSTNERDLKRTQSSVWKSWTKENIHFTDSLNRNEQTKKRNMKMMMMMIHERELHRRRRWRRPRTSGGHRTTQRWTKHPRRHPSERIWQWSNEFVKRKRSYGGMGGGIGGRM